MLLRDQSDDDRPVSAPAAVACVALAASYVYLAHRTMRGEGAWGMDPTWTHAATMAAFLLAFFTAWADRAWRRRRGTV